jgi:hypothetical protein
VSPTRKTSKQTSTAKKATTRKATTRKATTRKATRRRTTTTTRRARPKVATTVGAALGTLVVSLLLDASWPLRIGLVLLALVLVGGYLYLQGRRHDAAEPPVEQSTPSASPPSATPPSATPPSATPPSATPSSEDTP